MSNSGRVFPSFGVSRSKHNHHNSSGQPGIPNLLHAALQQQQQQQQASSNPTPAASTPAPAQQSMSKIRVMNVTHQQTGTPGEICLNTEDNLIYYYNGRKWMPLAVGNDHELAVENGNVSITAHTVPGKTGGNVTITSGMGGFADGVINLNIGKESAIVIDEKQVVIHDRELILKRGERMITLPIEAPPLPAPVVIEEKKQHAPERFELSEDSTSVITTGQRGAIQINRAITNGETWSFEMENETIQGKSAWIQVTAHIEEGAGVPNMFIRSVKDGRCEIGVRAMEADITKMIVYYHI